MLPTNRWEKNNDALPLDLNSRKYIYIYIYLFIYIYIIVKLIDKSGRSRRLISETVPIEEIEFARPYDLWDWEAQPLFSILL